MINDVSLLEKRRRDVLLSYFENKITWMDYFRFKKIEDTFLLGEKRKIRILYLAHADSRFHNLIYERDFCKCVVCGENERYWLQVHHVIYIISDFERDELIRSGDYFKLLITLCHKCHKKMHKYRNRQVRKIRKENGFINRQNKMKRGRRKKFVGEDDYYLHELSSSSVEIKQHICLNDMSLEYMNVNHQKVNKSLNSTSIWRGKKRIGLFLT